LYAEKGSVESVVIPAVGILDIQPVDVGKETEKVHPVFRQANVSNQSFISYGIKHEDDRLFRQHGPVELNGPMMFNCNQ
jgi:hypothetical protein